MATFGGPWTQQKLEILRAYLDAYTTALRDRPFKLIYVDAFAGEGFWRPGSGYFPEDYEEFGEVLKGSAIIALEIQDRPFDRFLFIEKDLNRIASLNRLALQFQGQEREIQVVNEDANVVLPHFCSTMGPYDRAVVFLDPFSTEVSWTTITAISGSDKIDCWILFPLGAINRNMPIQNEPTPQLAAEFDRVFGGREYWQDFYRQAAQQPLLPDFTESPLQERPQGSELIANRYRQRLESVFYRVAPTSRTLNNSRGVALFELFFAATNPRGAPIAVQIADHLLKNW
ncbi:MAG: three-Cys-motif partner protein TcmP [Chloroflexi bacterium]|nr:three-Cys-motif partner protein TcmP [Chloroflexota bacterium]